MAPIGDQAWATIPCLSSAPLQLGLLEVGMELDLVDRRRHRGRGYQSLDVLGHESC
jgi:hypothetical protein